MLGNPAATPAASLLYQNSGFGLLNPDVLGTSINQARYSPSVVSGMSPSTKNHSEAAASPLGLRAAYGMQSSINDISPSVIGSYGSQAALQGLGTYQSAQLGQSSAATTVWSPYGVGSLGTLPSCLRR